MNLKILREYCRKCKLYGWTASWDGLKAYKAIKERGLLNLWNPGGRV